MWAAHALIWRAPSLIWRVPSLICHSPLVRPRPCRPAGEAHHQRTRRQPKAGRGVRISRAGPQTRLARTRAALALDFDGSAGQGYREGHDHRPGSAGQGHRQGHDHRAGLIA
eukprot:4485942-Prymnesium_polylepis.2